MDSNSKKSLRADIIPIIAAVAVAAILLVGLLFLKISKKKVSGEDVQSDYFESGEAYENQSRSTNECVDLGLSVYWATCNFGASAPEAKGYYYSWDDFNMRDNLPEIPEDTPRGMFEVLLVDIPVTLPLDHDVVHQRLGGGWHIPTGDQVKELVSNCYSEWTVVNNVYGRRFTSRKNDNSIFIPAIPDWDKILGEGPLGLYLSSSLNPRDWDCVQMLEITGESASVTGYFWDISCQIRPVCDKW